MALIKCPECENEVSDKAISCPHCGNPISSNIQTISNETNTKIADNNNVIEVDETEFSTITANKSNRKIVIIIIAVVCLIAAITTSIVIISNNQKKEKEKEKALAEQTRITYIDNLNKLKDSALSGAAEVESLGGTIHDIWYNCINKVYDKKTNKYTIDEVTNTYYSDFNDALEKYMYGDFLIDIVKVNLYYNEIEDYYTALQNPTDEFKKCYEAMEDMYDVYLEFYSIVKNPSGSLITYTKSFNEKDTEFMNAYNKYKELVPLSVND